MRKSYTISSQPPRRLLVARIHRPAAVAGHPLVYACLVGARGDLHDALVVWAAGRPSTKPNEDLSLPISLGEIGGAFYG
jgi:hypothetical protein